MSASGLKIARGFELPLDLVTEATAIVATRGAGKSSTSAVIVEEGFVADVQTVVMDRTGVYWGLRSNVKGDGPGLPIYVLGGPHGDVPLEPHAGKLIADLVVDSGHSFVLDLSDFSKNNAVKFAADFLEHLYDRKARSRTTTLLVIDEAHFYAPQTPRGGFKGDSARLMGAMEDIVGLGRSRGLGVVLTTQRTQALNKAVLDLIETLIVMRMLSPRARAAVREWIQEKHEDDEQGVIASLDSLPTGTGWVWAPLRGILQKVSIRRIRTFDSYATPKPGETRAEPTKRRELDLGALGEQMRETAERAKDNDPAELRKRLRTLEHATQDVADLRETLTAVQEAARAEGETAAEALVNFYIGVSVALDSGYSANVVDEVRALDARPAEIQTVEVPVLTAEMLVRLREFVLDVENAHDRTTDAYDALRGWLYPLAANVKDALDQAARSAVPSRLQGHDPATTRVAPGNSDNAVQDADARGGTRRRPSSVSGRIPSAADRTERSGPEAAPDPGSSGGASSSLSTSHLKVLNALAWYEALGVSPATTVQIALVAGYSHTSGGYKNLISKLNTMGMIDVSGKGASKSVALTPAGRAETTDQRLPGTNEEVQEAVMARLPNPQAKLLQEIINVWPNTISREELAERTGYSASSGGYKNLLSKLRTGALIDYAGGRDIVALDVLFPMG